MSGGVGSRSWLCERLRSATGTDGILKVLEEAEKSHSFESRFAYSYALKLAAKRKDFKLAGKISLRLSKSPGSIDVVSLNALMHACAEAGHVAQALSVFLKLRTTCGHRTVESYNIMINAFSKERSFDQCYALIKQMQEESLSPNAFTYSPIIEELARLKRTDEAQHVIAMAEVNHVKFDARLYNALLLTHANSEEKSAAMQVFNNLKEKGVGLTIEHYHTVLDSIAQTGDTATAEMLFAELVRNNPDEAPTKLSYTALLRAYLRSKDAKGAEDVFHRMEAAGVKPDILTFNTMIELYGSLNDFTTALKYFELVQEHPDVEPNAFTYAKMNEAQAISGNLSQTIADLLFRGEDES